MVNLATCGVAALTCIRPGLSASGERLKSSDARAAVDGNEDALVHATTPASVLAESRRRVARFD